MSEKELGGILNSMYHRAQQGDQVAHIHLFGVMYGPIIIKNKYRVNKIVAESGLNSSYTTEVSKGIKLSKFVEPKSL